MLSLGDAEPIRTVQLSDLGTHRVAWSSIGKTRSISGRVAKTGIANTMPAGSFAKSEHVYQGTWTILQHQDP